MKSFFSENGVEFKKLLKQTMNYHKRWNNNSRYQRPREYEYNEQPPIRRENSLKTLVNQPSSGADRYHSKSGSNGAQSSSKSMHSGDSYKKPVIVDDWEDLVDYETKKIKVDNNRSHKSQYRSPPRSNERRYRDSSPGSYSNRYSHHKSNTNYRQDNRYSDHYRRYDRPETKADPVAQTPFSTQDIEEDLNIPIKKLKPCDQYEVRNQLELFSMDRGYREFNQGQDQRNFYEPTQRDNKDGHYQSGMNSMPKPTNNGITSNSPVEGNNELTTKSSTPNYTEFQIKGEYKHNGSMEAKEVISSEVVANKNTQNEIVPIETAQPDPNTDIELEITMIKSLERIESKLNDDRVEEIGLEDTDSNKLDSQSEVQEEKPLKHKVPKEVSECEYDFQSSLPKYNQIFQVNPTLI